MILVLFILEAIFGLIAIVYMGFRKPWESYLFLAIAAVCVVVSRMI